MAKNVEVYDFVLSPPITVKREISREELAEEYPVREHTLDYSERQE